ncbi:hypothetical protein Ping_1964 [Psychromonas ingrahamii 37]|uniref:Lipoprotein n=1 Tax=Psychromonas ingrahamii (strain DSM 17664 / CCUG 51855 / 37) TaxID=357804 RepID=A1SW67_PSYIN|nr:hypothetical protein [Psychromonas ingrahamii]ABM03732.1 hypothetical protein Ping_1964 [Psychromonas ingrahamii 37]
MLKKSLLVVALASILTGCGGSSDSTDTGSTTYTVIDGYLSAAEVYVLSPDGSTKTLIGETDINGKIQIPTEYEGYTVIAKIIAGKTIDNDSPGIPVTKSYEMRGTADSTVVTPFTTLANINVMTLTDLALELELEEADVGGDYVKSPDGKAHLVARTLAARLDDDSSNDHDDADHLKTLAGNSVTYIRDNHEQHGDDLDTVELYYDTEDNLSSGVRVDSHSESNDDSSHSESTDTTESTDTGSTDTSSTYTGSTDTESTDTGSTDTSSTYTGSTDTSSTYTGSTDTSSTYTGSTDTKSTYTGSTDTESTDTGSADTESTYTGSADTESTETESTDTGSADTGSTYTGSTETGSTTYTVIDGYLSAAEVYVLSPDGSTETLIGETNTSGQIQIPVEYNGYTVIAKIIAGKTIDNDSPGTFVTKSYEMRGTADSTVVTPFTTIANINVMTLTDLALYLDLDEADVGGDYVNSLDGKAHLVARTLAARLDDDSSNDHDDADHLKTLAGNSVTYISENHHQDDLDTVELHYDTEDKLSSGVRVSHHSESNNDSSHNESNDDSSHSESNDDTNHSEYD